MPPLQTVKKSAKVIIERYYPKLTLDFETNKRICDEIAIIASKRLRNKVRKPNILPSSPRPGPLHTKQNYHYEILWLYKANAVLYFRLPATPRT